MDGCELKLYCDSRNSRNLLTQSIVTWVTLTVKKFIIGNLPLLLEFNIQIQDSMFKLISDLK